MESINKRQFYQGRQIPVCLTQMDYPELIYDEIDSFSFDDRLITDFISVLRYICAIRRDKGILVSGAFGVGKSYFLKYVLFCISREYHERAFSHLLKLSGDSIIRDEIQRIHSIIDSLSIDSVVLDCLMVSPYPAQAFLLSLHKCISGFVKQECINCTSSNTDITIDAICNDLRALLMNKPENYRLVLLWEDINTFFTEINGCILIHDVVSRLVGEFGDVVGILASCQMDATGNNNQYLQKVINASMNRFHLTIE